MSDPTPAAQGPAAPAHPGSDAVSERAAAPLDRSSYAVAINRGYGQAMSRGIELALTLVVVGAIGWFIDGAVGTSPVFTLIFSLVGFAGIAVKLKLGYDLEMREHEADAVWNRTPGSRGAASGRTVAQ